MIRLDNTKRSLKAILSGALIAPPALLLESGDLLLMEDGGVSLIEGGTVLLPDVVVAFSEKTTKAFPPSKAGVYMSQINSRSYTTICPPPTNLTVREVDAITIKNNNALTASATVTYNDNGNEFKLITAEIGQSETLFYTSDSGWRVIDENGDIKK